MEIFLFYQTKKQKKRKLFTEGEVPIHVHSLDIWEHTPMPLHQENALVWDSLSLSFQNKFYF